MIIIGEKINSSIPSTFDAMRSGGDAILALIKTQVEAGANYLDVNTAMFGENELDMMKIIVHLILENSDCGIMLDSPNQSVIAETAKLCCERELILNSVTTNERIDELAPIAAELGCGIVVLPMNETNKIPETAEKRLVAAKIAIKKLLAYGIAEDKIYVDAICETLATCDTNAKTAIETIRQIKSETGVKTLCGLSNVSFGLPKRSFINAAFLTIALYCGLDAAILDPCSKELRKSLYSAEAVAGIDEYCVNYIGYVRREYL